MNGQLGNRGEYDGLYEEFRDGPLFNQDTNEPVTRIVESFRDRENKSNSRKYLFPSSDKEDPVYTSDDLWGIYSMVHTLRGESYMYNFESILDYLRDNCLDSVDLSQGLEDIFFDFFIGSKHLVRRWRTEGEPRFSTLDELEQFAIETYEEEVRTNEG